MRTIASRQRLAVLATLAVLALAAAPARAADTALRWHVVADGAPGDLALRTTPAGRLEGTLLGRRVEGWLVGRHLVLVRQGENGPETWEAWLATPENVHGDERPVLAGTFTRPGVEGPLPWFGTTPPRGPAPAPRPPAAPPRTLPAPPPTAPHAAVPAPPSFEPAPGAASGGPPPAAAPRLPTGQPDVAGTWETPDGPLEILQEGSRLTFVLPDRRVDGRLTGPDSLIGGFGPGCCKGHLEQAFTVIAWDNGVRWYRR